MTNQTQKAPPEAEERRVRPFADFLREHNSGAGHEEASEALRDLAVAVTELGKKGSVTIQVAVEPMKGAEGTLMTTVVVTPKLPVAPAKPAVFYADSEGNMTRTDPAQRTFDGMKDVSAPVVKEAPAGPAVRVAGGDA